MNHVSTLAWERPRLDGVKLTFESKACLFYLYYIKNRLMINKNNLLKLFLIFLVL